MVAAVSARSLGESMAATVVAGSRGGGWGGALQANCVLRVGDGEGEGEQRSKAASKVARERLTAGRPRRHVDSRPGRARRDPRRAGRQNFRPWIHVTPADFDSLTRNRALCEADGTLTPQRFESMMREQVRDWDWVWGMLE